MSKLKFPVVGAEDILDLRCNTDFEISNNNVARPKKERKEENPYFQRSVSHTALEFKSPTLDYDEKQFEQYQINTLKKLGRSHSRHGGGFTYFDEKKYKLRSRTLDPRFRRSRSPLKVSTISQAISAITPTEIKTHHNRPETARVYSNSLNDYNSKELEITCNNEDNSESKVNIKQKQKIEKATMTNELNSILNENCYERKFNKDENTGQISYWNDIETMHESSEPNLASSNEHAADDQISSEEVANVINEVPNIQRCPWCHHFINTIEDDRSDTNSETANNQPIFSKVSKKISTLFSDNIDLSKIHITKFLLGYITALIIVTVTIIFFILLDPSPILAIIEEILYEKQIISRPEKISPDPKIIDLIKSTSYSFLKTISNCYSKITNIITSELNEPIPKMIKKNRYWWPF